MLFPKNVTEFMASERKKFSAYYVRLLDQQKEIMIEHGDDRDTETPLHIRRPPMENLSLAKGKVLRVQSLLMQIEQVGPTTYLLEKTIEECLDVANYIVFVATLCSMVLEEDSEVESGLTLNLSKEEIEKIYMIGDKEQPHLRTGEIKT